MASKSRRRGVEHDLARCGELSLEDITAYIHSAYNQNQLYSWAGSNLMLALAPSKSIKPTLFSESVRALWIQRYKNGMTPKWPGGQEPVPHIFGLANSVYFQMRRSGIDQSVVFSGDSGCAKSLQQSLFVEHMCAISGASKRDERLGARVLAALTVLNAFGCAKTLVSDDSSCFGAYYELQFSDKGRLDGLKIITFALDIQRLTVQAAGERSFHSLYFLLAGAPDDIRQQFYLAPNGPFGFLTNGISSLPTIDDKGRFQAWVDAMKLVGMGRRLQMYIFSVLAAILHLGNIVFIETSDGCRVSNIEALNLVASLLEIEPNVLNGALTSKIAVVGSDVTSVLLTCEAACNVRDSLGQTIYNLLFLWIVEHLNKKLSVQASNYVSIVDFPGKSSTRFGYCNERLQELIYRRLFNYGSSELRQQGLDIKDVEYQLETKRIDAISRRPQTAQVIVPPDFLLLFLGGNGIQGTSSQFLQSVFGEALNASENIEAEMLQQRKKKYQWSSPRPIIFRQRPSFMDGQISSSETRAAPGSIIAEMDVLIEALSKTNIKSVFCISLSLDRESTMFEERHVRSQLQNMLVHKVVNYLAPRNGANYSIRFQIADFVLKYAEIFSVQQDGSRAAATKIRDKIGAAPFDLHVGPNLVVLRDELFNYLEECLRRNEMEDKIREKKGLPPRNRAIENLDFTDSTTIISQNSDEDVQSNFGTDDLSFKSFPQQTTRTQVKSNPIHGKYLLPHELEPEPESKSPTFARKFWLAIVWILTFWIPSPLLWVCGKKNKDVRTAWREKVAIFLLILFCCAFQIFIVIGFGQVICPRQNILNINELFYGSTNSDPLVAINGGIYRLNSFFSKVYHAPVYMTQYGGLDISAGFPKTPAYFCQYAAERQPNFPAFYNSSTSTLNGTFIQSRHASLYARDLRQAQYYIDSSLKQNLYKMLGWSIQDINFYSTNSTTGRLRKMVAIHNRVYDLQPYKDTLPNNDADFLPSGILGYIDAKAGSDLSNDKIFMSLWNSDENLRICFNNLFLTGVVDFRKSPRCLFTNYVLLAFSVLIISVIGAKFLAALQFTSPGVPEEHEKFVILQIPCYTEGEESLRQSIDSLATLEYDDKRKLLFIVCDGNIMGAGNDKPTPRIVLDILGIGPEIDPEPLSFQSVGEGEKQHNMGKIYSGLYEVQGHLVPFLVVVKIGTPSESSKPGNRGKRDSQMILMRFLNHYYLEMPMSPLELELCHQIKNVIGVNPSFYEYCLMVDADTVVSPDSLTRLVSVMMHDTKVMGVCGETLLANEKDTWATMIQVYEYYISHHLSKAFESLFGSVTCLPGCFSMYRLRSPSKNVPLLAATPLIRAYGDCNVNTLHKKNLLSLGEDRYLTTLLLKNFPRMRTVFTPHAKCQTIAPENWNVLLSQRRRWINSTVHNLVELLNINALCGFCCFSMRFIVFLDLISTLIQPAIVLYLGYLVYLVVNTYVNHDPNTFPTVSLILLAAIYGLQAIIFLIKREWQHIGWMVIYLFAIPVFSFMIPLYSFWQMDNFSWGSTRKVYGGDKDSKIKSQAVEFDLRSIPHKRWREYESELWIQHGAKLEAMGVAPMDEISNVEKTENIYIQSDGQPTNDEIYAEIERILTTADLMTITKRQVREELTLRFQTDLSSRRDVINKFIAEILSRLV